MLTQAGINVNIADGIATTGPLGTAANPLAISAAIAGSVARTAAFSTVTASGNVAAGAKSASFYNSGTTAATVAGGSLPAGQSVRFSVDGVDTLSAIAYTASATAILQIATVA